MQLGTWLGQMCLLGDVWVLCCLGYACELGPGVGLWEAISLHGVERAFLWHVLSSQQERLVRIFALQFRFLLKGRINIEALVRSS